MPATPILPGYAGLSRDYRSRALLHWRAADASIHALSGQTGTFARTGTATGTDALGGTATYRQHQPAWTTLSGRLALRLGPAAGLEWAFARSAFPGALSAYVSLRHDGFGYTAGGGGYVALESAAAANPRWRILEDAGSNNGTLRTLHHNGTSSVTSTLGSGIADATDCEYLVTFAATGAIQVTRVTAAGATTIATASGTLTPTSFSGNVLRVFAPVALYAVKLAAGARSLDEMRELG